MYKKDLALNNLQWLICHKTKLNVTNLADESFSGVSGRIRESTQNFELNPLFNPKEDRFF